MGLPLTISDDQTDREKLADLVEAIAQKADRQAFAALFRYFAPRVKGYGMRLGASAAEAEELAQDVLLTVWRKAATFDRRQAGVSTWLFTITRNRRIDILRREKRPELDPNDPLLVPDAPVAPDEAASQVARAERLSAAIKTLPKDQADLLREAFYKARSHSEIAADTQLPLGTVKSRLRLAFGRLRRALEGHDE